MFYGDVLKGYVQLISYCDKNFNNNIFTYETKIFYIQCLYKDNQFNKAISIID